ncbi:MAG: tetratricopeptide repeat protein [Candidatus Kapaibacterium sp.]
MSANPNDSAGPLTRWAPLLLLLLAIAVYGRTATYDLSYCDDVEIIIRHYDRIADAGRWDDEIMRGYMETDYYRPAVNLTFWLDAQIAGQSPWIYHVTNIIIHFLAVLMLFYLLRTMRLPRSIPLIAAAALAVHPLAVNAVAWIPGRNDMLWAMFGFIAFLGLIKFRNSFKYIWLIVHFVGFLLAALSKETALVLPIIFIAWIILFRNKKIINRENLLLAGMWIIAGIIWYIMRNSAQLGESVNRTGIDVFTMNLPVIAEFFGKFFIPANLSVLPVYSQFATLSGIFFMAALVAIAIINKRRNRRLFIFGAVWYLAPLLPAMFVTMLNSSDWNEYLECRAYFSMAGILLMLFASLPERWFDLEKRASRLVIVVILIIWALMAYVETQNYRGPREFYESAVEDHPGRALYHEILGNIYERERELASAESQYQMMIRSNPEYAKYYTKIGGFYIDQGRYGDAIGYLEKGLAEFDSSKTIYGDLAMAYWQTGEFDRADSLLGVALGIWPRDFDLLFAKFIVSQSTGDTAGVFESARKIREYGHPTASLGRFLAGWMRAAIDEQNYDLAARYAHMAIDLRYRKSEVFEYLYKYYYEINPDYTKASEYALEAKKLGAQIDPEALSRLKKLNEQGN